MSSAVRKIKTIRNNKPKINKILRNEGKRVRLFLLVAGIVLTYIGLNYPQRIVSSDNIPMVNTSKKNNGDPISINHTLLATDENKIKNNAAPIRISLPSAGIDIPVRQAKVVNGYWELFNDSAGWGTGSGYPGEKGNIVIFAHAREKLFLPLKKAKIGENVTVFTEEKWYQYKIADIKEVLPTDTEVISPTPDETLTLYTCSGFSDSKRLILTAKRT